MIFEIFLFLLPAGFANMAPVLFKWVNFLNKPISAKLGKNKTYRGFFFGTLAGIFIVYLQKLIDINSIVNYSEVHVIALGFLLGFGALLGDSVKSYFKRLRDIKPGKQWAPFDQIDWIVGSLLLVSFYVELSLLDWVIALLLFGLLHPVINLVGYYLGIKKNKY